MAWPTKFLFLVAIPRRRGIARTTIIEKFDKASGGQHLGTYFVSNDSYKLSDFLFIQETRGRVRIRSNARLQRFPTAANAPVARQRLVFQVHSIPAVFLRGATLAWNNK
jgi:hypothetical protein